MNIKTELVYKNLRGIARAVEQGNLDAALLTYEQTKNLDPFLLETFIAIYERRLLSLKHSFIYVNNMHVQRLLKGRPENILVLLPFCLQSTLCKHRIIWNIENCKECGLCPVGHIKGLSEDYDFTIKMAERGVMAKDILKAENPELTIAVACADELFEGIVRCRNKLVYGIQNCIQEQYCINTLADSGEVSAALKKFTNF